MRRLVCLLVFLGAVTSRGAELKLSFADTPLNTLPPGFRSAVTGQGGPGDWRVVLDNVPSSFVSVVPNAPAPPKRPVLAQTSEELTDERYPLLIYDSITFGDFTLTTKFKTVRGVAEQMAGIAFRLQDEKNYYYVRASSLGQTFRFVKVVNGQRAPPIGPEVEIPSGVWHELTIRCTGNEIRCLLNGKELIPPLQDNTFSEGKIAFWTKSDSVSHFTDTQITYTPRERLATAVIREVLQQYPRLIGLRVYTIPLGKKEAIVAAGSIPGDVGKAGGIAELDVIASDRIYYSKNGPNVSVTMPMHDRNGDTVAAVQITMKSFKGQTEQNAVARALPIIKLMESRLRAAEDIRN